MRYKAIVTVLVLTVPLLFTTPAVADHEYELTMSNPWNTTELNVLILGVHDPIVGQAIMDGIRTWETGIEQLAPGWLAESFRLNVYFPARDPSPPQGWDPGNIHIYFVPHGFQAVITPFVCIAFAPLAHEYATHGPSALYRTAAHEFGHCLQLGHVFEHGVEYSPRFDLMGGGRDHACVSNLNIMALEKIFSGERETVTISASEYRQADC